MLKLVCTGCDYRSLVHKTPEGKLAPVKDSTPQHEIMERCSYKKNKHRVADPQACPFSVWWEVK